MKLQSRMGYRISLVTLNLIFPMLFSCEENPEKIPSWTKEKRLNAVIEIPAGTNRKIEYNSKSGKFLNDSIGGEQRLIHYLPYPLNYGFVPSTSMEKSRGGDGDPLDVLVLSESISSGEVIEVIPIALLLMKDKGELDHKVLAVPADPRKRVVETENFESFTRLYPSIQQILELWFRNYDLKDPKEMLGWKDENEAVREVQKWQVKQ